MRTLRVLDLCSGAGGAAVGYNRAARAAGLRALITGVDTEPQPNYPFAFIMGDAIKYLADRILTAEIQQYDLVHLSPPCQKDCALTVGTNEAMGWGGDHVDLIAAFRQLLPYTGLPFVIEQPTGRAPIRRDVTLCGEMFGLGVLRHRNFELGGWSVAQPPHPAHRGRVRGWRHGEYFDGPYVAAYGEGGGKASVEEMQAAMGIDWTESRLELTEAIPPAYTEWLGRAFVEQVQETDRVEAQVFSSSR